MRFGRRSLAAAIVLIAYAPFAATIVQVSATNFYARHIVFVPVFAGALLWIERDHFRGLTGHRGLGGPAVLAAALAVLGYGYAVGSMVSQVLSLVGAVAGLILWFHGPRGLRRSAFVLAFLLLTIPPPQEAIAVIAPGIQHTVAAFSAAVSELLQIPVEHDGIVLRIPGLTLQVVEACAGLRFSFILIVFVAAFARVALPTRSGQAGLILLSVPVVMLANAMRVATITVGAYAVGPHVATGRLHDYIGKAFWLLAVLAMIGIAMLLRSRAEDLTLRRAPARAR